MSPAPPPRSPSAATLGIAGALLYAVVALAWSWSTPLMGAPDEPTQTVKAVAVASGELRGRDLVSRSEAPPGENRVDTEVVIPEGYAEVFELNACYVFLAERPVGCAPQPIDDDDPTVATTYVGTYPPAYYVLVGWPSQLLPAPAGLWAMRLCTIVACAAMVGVALTACRRLGRRGLVAGGLLVAATPMTVFFSGVINSTGFEITAALATWATALAVVAARQPSTADLVRLVVAFALLVATRPLSPVFGVGILVAVALLAGTRPALAALAARRDARWCGAVALVALAASSGWVLWSRAYDSVAGTPIPGLTLREALEGSASRLPTRLHEMIGYFGYREVPAPRTLVVLWTTMVAVLLLAALVRGSWRQRGVLVAAVLATLAFNVVPEAISAREYGYIGQGRYALPIGVGVPLLAAWVVATRTRPARWWRPALLVTAVAWAVGMALGQAAVLRRNVVGLTNGFFEFLGGTGWEPPLPPAALWVLGLVAALGFGGWVVLAPCRDDERDPLAPTSPSPGAEATPSPVGAT